MRTTVTLDADVVRLLKDRMHQDRRSFKETLNTALRKGLTAKAPAKRKKVVIRSRPMGLRPEFDGLSASRILDQLDLEAYLRKEPKLKSNDRS